MIWKGKTLTTFGDLMRDGIEKCDSPAEARNFMRILRAEGPHADENIGYLSGYYSPTEMVRIQDWFEVSHPVFGKGHVTPEVAFARGVAMGAKVRGDHGSK